MDMFQAPLVLDDGPVSVDQILIKEQNKIHKRIIYWRFGWRRLFGWCLVGQANGAPETIRTSDLPLRRRLLYPTELPGRIYAGRYCRDIAAAIRPVKSGLNQIGRASCRERESSTVCQDGLHEV